MGGQMNKILLSIFAGLSIIFSANAALDQNSCLENPDEFVWVDATNECIPINPCTDDQIKETYCKSVNSMIPEEFKEKFASVYTKEVMNKNAQDIQLLDSIKDNEYTSIKTTDGEYYVIESMNSETDESYSTLNMIKIACAAYGYNTITNENINCLGVDNQIQCKNIANFASQLANESVSGNFVEKTSEYKSYCELE